MEAIQLICSRGRTETQVYLISKPVPNLHTTCKEKNADAKEREIPALRRKPAEKE